jgi:hypothetical protein
MARPCRGAQASHFGVESSGRASQAIYCASVSPTVRCVSTIVRRTAPSVSANVRRKWPSIARRDVYYCTPLHVVIDMAVIAYANAMRVQSIIGNTALIIEGEMFGQPTLRAKWKKEYGARPEDIRGLAVEDYVVRLREMLLPLVEKFNHSARDAIEGIRRQRQMPSIEVERLVPWEISLIPAERGSS